MQNENTEVTEIGGDVYLTTEETANELRVSPRTLERLRQVGTGPAFCRLGRRVVYGRRQIREYVASRTFTSTAEASLSARP